MILKSKKPHINKKNIIFELWYIPFLFFVVGCGSLNQEKISTESVHISWNPSSINSWTYTIQPEGKSIEVQLPVFEIDGKETPMVLSGLKEIKKPVLLRNGATEYVYEGAVLSDTTLRLRINFRIAPDNPVVRFSYSLKTSGIQRLTKKTGKDNFSYLAYSMKDFPRANELRLGVFNERIHSCRPVETSLDQKDFTHSSAVMGPVLLGGDGQFSFLVAYEHGSMFPNAFLEYCLNPSRTVELRSVKGNYYDGQPVDGYSTLWFEIGGVRGNEDILAARYRDFMLKYLAQNTESRKPYIYYNTWGRQERDKWAGGQYQTNMNLEWTLKEVDRAHEMGVDVYVIDVGWFAGTGDWKVNLKKYPDGLKQIQQKAEGYGMKLGVWFDPAMASLLSDAYARNKNCLMAKDGNFPAPELVYETEESVPMCLVSPYWETFADAIIQLAGETGIRNFYLDGMSQQGCNEPGHFHGTSANSPEERHLSYSFLLPVYLAKVMGKVSSVYPDAVFDIDVTESVRIGVGIQFLEYSRYFVINNGPYFHNYDICPRRQSVLPNGNRNIFVYPGPARGWFIRQTLEYDKWIPSTLFLANYQPDDPRDSQIINLASMVLGQNGIWGEILKTSPEGVALFNDVIGKYKQVRDDVARANPVRIGDFGDSPEIHEKIDPQTGKGVVVIFANLNCKNTYTYITKNKVVNDIWHNEGVVVERGKDGVAVIKADFEYPSAKIIFFGLSN